MDTVNEIASKRDQEKPFGTVLLNGEILDLVRGKEPHSRQDNYTYARDSSGRLHDFSGHRICFRVDISEYNYMKESDLSGNEIREGCSVKIYANDVQVWDEFARSWENGMRKAQNFIVAMEMNWSWFPQDCKKEIGRIIGYKEYLFKIDSFVISQACLILKPLDGKSVPRFLWESDDYYEQEDTIKVDMLSECITWFPVCSTCHRDIKRN